MKKLILLPLFAFMALVTKAQDSTSLYQMFYGCDSILDISGTYNHFPPGWSAYSVIGAQDWRCEPDYGLENQPCFHINGYQAGASNQNENWLFTPQLNLSSYAGSIFFNFAATYYYAGDSLHIMVSKDYVAGTNPDSLVGGSPLYTWVELQHYGVMLYDTFYNVVGMYDEFQCDLTPYKTSPVYVAFKYTSNISNSSVWDLDSVTTGTISFGPIPGGSTGITNTTKQQLPLQVIGISTPNQVKMSFDVPQGEYTLAIYDLLGRKLYNQNIQANGGNQVLTISDAYLANGMYLLKLSNENASGITKFGVQ